MKATTLLRASALAALSLLWMAPLHAAAPAKILVFSPLETARIPAVLAASERLVWNRKTGVAVAEVPEAGLGKVEALMGEGTAVAEKGMTFQEALEAYLPGYVPEGDERERRSGPYAVKAPASLVKGKAAVRALAGARAIAVPEAGTCVSEGFEDFELPIWYENGGDWWHYEGGQPDNAVGDYFWLDWNCDARTGSYSADSILGGTYGQSVPCWGTYDYNTDSWLEYAPWITCAAGVPEANLDFFTTLETEADYDLFYYVVSVDGVNYDGYSLSGDWSDAWYWVSQDLRSWYGVGDLTTYPYFALAFVFQSDDLVNQGFGARVDDIALTATALSAMASADATQGLVPFEVHFTGLVQGGTPPFVYRWDFGDGSPSSDLQNPVHVYTAAGSYAVAFTVEDAEGEHASGGLTVTASDPVVPVITAMVRKRRPFRIAVYGSNLMRGIRVFIDGQEWTKVKWKKEGKIVIKKGRPLKAAVPKGVLTPFLFENPDGSVATFSFSW